MYRLLTMLFLLFSVNALAGHENTEKFYQDQWCFVQGGTAEVILPDKTRADCITDTHSVEVDFAGKFYEAIGQALYYSMQTGKRAGVLLILENEGERKYWIRLNSVIQHFGLPVDTWAIGAGSY